MDAQQEVVAFVEELRAVVEKHYGTLKPGEVEPFGMQLRQALAMVSSDTAGTVTTSVTITLPQKDTDDPDQD